MWYELGVKMAVGGPEAGAVGDTVATAAGVGSLAPTTLAGNVGAGAVKRLGGTVGAQALGKTIGSKLPFGLSAIAMAPAAIAAAGTGDLERP